MRRFLGLSCLQLLCVNMSCSVKFVPSTTAFAPHHPDNYRNYAEPQRQNDFDHVENGAKVLGSVPAHGCRPLRAAGLRNTQKLTQWLPPVCRFAQQQPSFRHCVNHVLLPLIMGHCKMVESIAPSLTTGMLSAEELQIHLSMSCSLATDGEKIRAFLNELWGRPIVRCTDFAILSALHALSARLCCKRSIRCSKQHAGKSVVALNLSFTSASTTFAVAANAPTRCPSFQPWPVEPKAYVSVRVHVVRFVAELGKHELERHRAGSAETSANHLDAAGARRGRASRGREHQHQQKQKQKRQQKCRDGHHTAYHLVIAPQKFKM